LGYWNVSYGNCQLSRDRKSAVFVLRLDGGYTKLLKVDGRAGNVKYMHDMRNTSYRATHDLTYLLFCLLGYELSGNKSDGLFILVDLEKNEIVRTIEWKKGDGPWGSGAYQIHRSLDSQYDFRIDFTQEPGLVAKAYYNIEQDHLETTFDITDIGGSTIYEYAREREKLLPEESGWQAIPDIEETARSRE
jgi:hypothetical protein